MRWKGLTAVAIVLRVCVCGFLQLACLGGMSLHAVHGQAPQSCLREAESTHGAATCVTLPLFEILSRPFIALQVCCRRCPRMQWT
jgi:hypothetical protein